MVFIMTGKQKITVEELLSRDWDTHEDNQENAEALFWSWADLLEAINVELIDEEKIDERDIETNSLDFKTYNTGTYWVSFMER